VQGVLPWIELQLSGKVLQGRIGIQPLFLRKGVTGTRFFYRELWKEKRDMVTASDIRVGNVLKIDGKLCKVLTQEQQLKKVLVNKQEIEKKRLEESVFAEKHIEAVHDKGFLAFLKKVSMNIDGDKSIY